MKVMRKIIEIDEDLCDGCGNCIVSCAEAALEIVDGKAKLVKDIYCDGLGACIGDCPTGALKIVEREAEDFDEEAVEKRLEEIETKEPQPAAMACGCPSTNIREFDKPPVTPCQAANQPAAQQSPNSELTHWPVQIRLIPPTAKFLKDRDILVAADCAPIAYPNFHGDFIKDKAVLIGCPKFDNQQEYIDKVAAIFSEANIKSITVAIMEPPCCSGLPMVIEKAMKTAGKQIPMEKIIISPQGQITKKEKLVA
jgi:Pyruvate/2-oxoacid:ferredoxin oxidoreductase delta subunit